MSAWRDRLPTPVFLGFPYGSAGKEFTSNAGDLGLIPELGRSPGEGKGYPFQYSDLENSMDCIVHGVTKSKTWLSNFHSLTYVPICQALCYGNVKARTESCIYSLIYLMAGEPYNKDNSNINNKGYLRSDSRGTMTSTWELHQFCSPNTAGLRVRRLG